MNKITIELSSQWVLSCVGAEKLPVDAIAGYITEQKLGKVENRSFTGISFTSETVSANDTQGFKDQLIAYLQGIFQENAQELSGMITVSVEAVEVVETPEEPPQIVEEKTVQWKLPQMGKPSAPAGNAMEEIRQLQGAEQFIALCEQIKTMAPVLCQRSLQSVATSISYLFSIDPGCGYTRALELLGRLMNEESLFGGRGEPVEIMLEAASGNENPLESAASKLSHAKDKLIALDISNWCDKVATPEFRAFLLQLQKSAGKNIYVFRLPYLERSVLDGVEEALSDVLRIKTVTFIPLTAAQLQTVSEKLFAEKGFSVSADGWELFQRRMAEEKSDGLFYGIKTAQKIVDDMIFLKVQSILAGTSSDDNVIAAEDLQGLVASVGPVLSAEEELNKLLGIEQIREKIYEIISQIEFSRQTPGVLTPAMHMRFVGNPGTGKTTVARIVGKLMKERGILSKGYFFEHAGGDFIGMYVGHTAPKTLALCRDAYGSVLFIDEAYTLADMNYGNGSGYAKEAVDTLIAQMENHRDDMVVIMAGYPEEMDKLMRLNPGLAGRIPYALEFPNYTREQLADIFASMVQHSQFTMTEEAAQYARQYFTQLDESVLSRHDFANARFVRNIFERTWAKTVTRSQMDGSDALLITKEDFCAATADGGDALQSKAKKRARVGYHVGLV